MARPERRLVLHIGAHKTGTSAIQVYLRNNQAKLQARGWELLLPPRPQGMPANWNFMFRVEPGPVFGLRPLMLDKMLAQIDKSRKDLILSSEELFFLGPQAIRDFAKAIAPRFDRVHLVAYLRRQDRMAISHWKQGAQTQQSAVLFGNTTGPFTDLSEAAHDYLDYATRLEAWIAAFAPGQVSCRVYDRACLAEGDAVTDFLQVAGLFPLTDTMPGASVNDALGTEIVFLLHELRAQGRPQSDIGRILRANILPEATVGGLPARAEAEAFMARFAVSNARLGEIVGQPVTFSEDFQDYPETARLPRYSEDQRAAIMKSIDRLLAKPAGTPAQGVAAPAVTPMIAKPATGRKTILLHVGAHKTGSTTIQNTFAENRDVLKRNGISYLTAEKNDNLIYAYFARHTDYGKIVNPTARYSPAERVELRVQKLRKELESVDTDTVFLSSEQFSLLKENGLTRMRDFFAPYGDVRVVYFYRDLVPWLSSHSQQVAKAGTADRPLPYKKGMLRIYEMPKRLQAVFGAANVTMHNFNDAVKTGLLDTLFNGLQVPRMAQMGIEEIRRNEGISAEAVRLLYLYNRYYPREHPGRDPAVIGRICALPGQKYTLAGITAKEHADYTAKYPEMTSELGLRLAPPEAVPIAEQADAATELMWQVLEQAGARPPEKTS